MIAVTLHFWDVSDSGEGRSADDFYMKQIEEEQHAARGAGYNHAGVFSHLFSRCVRCRYEESAAKVSSQLAVCWSLQTLLCSWVLRERRAQLTVARRPRGFGHVCKQLSFAVFPRRLQTSVCFSDRNLTASSWEGAGDVLGFLAESLQPKVVSLHIIPLE